MDRFVSDAIFVALSAAPFILFSGTLAFSEGYNFRLNIVN